MAKTRIQYIKEAAKKLVDSKTTTVGCGKDTRNIQGRHADYRA